ncbi:O-antigen ligase family protein [Citricoccus sp. NPDC055426]|uniref:O-antigen ligase family protein n=1 Tax=Citricoccus sp. NPDC055426 TaxID=3155536 RepID=UPI0034328615
MTDYFLTGSIVALMLSTAVIVCCIFRTKVLYLIPFLPLLVGPDFISESLAISGGSAILKGLSVGLLMICVLVTGVGQGRVLWGIYIFAVGFAAILPIAFGHVPLESWMIYAFVGYVFAWFATLIRLDKLDRDTLARTMTFVPILGILLNLLLDTLGLTELFRHEFTTGLLRLSGTLPSSHFGSLFVIGVIGGAWMYYRGIRNGLLFAFIHVMLCASTLTRGPLLVAVLIFAGAVLSNPPNKQVSKVAVYSSGAVAAIVVVFVFAEEIISRFQSSGLTGRDLAWAYYFDQFQVSPLLGHGIGAAAELSQYSRSANVREYFIAPHNTYLQLLVEVGMVGTSIILIALIGVALLAFKMTHRGFRPILAFGFIGYLIFGYFDNLLNSFQSTFGLVLLLSISIYAAGSLGHSEKTNHLQRYTKEDQRILA